MKAPGRYEDLAPAMGILEIRYPRAHAYWDRSGSLIAAIETAMPSLTCERLGPNGFEFKGAEGCGVQSAVFYWDRVILNQEADGSFGPFEALAVGVWSKVSEAFDLQELTRVGNRYGYLFPTESSAAADHLLNECHAMWSLGDALGAFGAPDAKGVALRTSLRQDNRRIRLEIATGDQSVRGKKRSGVTLDIDFSLADTPSVRALDLPEVLRWNHRFVKANLHNVLRSRR